MNTPEDFQRELEKVHERQDRRVEKLEARIERLEAELEKAEWCRDDNVRTIAAMVLSRRGLPVVVTNERLAEAGNHMVEIQYLAGCRHVKTRPLGMRA